MNNPISEAIYQPITDKLSPYSKEFLFAFIIFLLIFGLIKWYLIRKNKLTRS